MYMELKDISEIKSYKKINSPKKNESLDNERIRKVNNKMVKYSDLELYTMKYNSDGLKIFGFIFKHKNAKINTPVVIHCRGGNNLKKIGNLTIDNFYYHPLFELVKKNKIIIIASTYRGYRLSEGIDEFGGKDINDIINLYPIIKKYKYTDENKIAIFGVSRGVMMSLLVHKKVNWVKCLILVGGIADIRVEINKKKIIKELSYKKIIKKFNLTEEDIQKRSAINWISELPNKAPILILHGSNDDRSSVDNAYIFKEQFKKHKIPHKIVIYENGDHKLLNYINEFHKESIDWIEKYLLK